MRLRRGFPLICMLVLLGPVAFAGPVFVSNFSFEILPSPVILLAGCGTGCEFTIASENAIPGWSASNPDAAGQLNPGVSSGTTTYYNSVPDGDWIAYASAGNLTQSPATVVANTTYTLSVSLGLRKDFPALGTAELVVNGNAYVATGVAPSSGNWATFTAAYNSALHPADVGLPLTIELISNGTQAGFDDVTLNTDGVAAVPEPATMGFLGIGLTFVALLARGRNRR
jgi:hypothetical protein